MADWGKIIEKNLSWLSTMKQAKGYCGPVTHYWSDSLDYIGPGNDWRYEGLIKGFLGLYKKTGQKEFLAASIECGDFVLAAQKKSGAYLNSAFEANPSFNHVGTPHESSVDIGLIELSKELKSKHLEYQAYLRAAEINIKKIHYGKLYDPKEKTFMQYEKERAKNVENKFVPNKIATTCEALIGLYEMTHDISHLKSAIDAAEIILKLQDNKEFSGGIYQANDKKSIITFYTARCIPCLMKLYKHTKNKKYLEASKSAAVFIKKMWNPELGFEFGFLSNREKLIKHVSPIFLAGSADIIKALLLMKDYEKVREKKYLKGLLKAQDKSGGFQTAYGLTERSTGEEVHGKPSWKDVLHVVGWNDKALNLLTEIIDKDETIVKRPFEEVKISCSDGEYYETKEFIKISGQENYFLTKKRFFLMAVRD